MALSAMCTTPSAEPRRAAEVVELLECVEHVRKKRRVEILQPATFEQEFASVTSAMEALSPAIAKARQQQDQQPGITSALSEAESLLAQLAKEQLVGSIENVKKKQRADMMAEAVQSATLEQKIASATSAIDVLSPVIAKAEYDQLVSPWIISGARNLHAALATERLRAAANYAQEKGSLDYLQSAIAKADNERLVDDFDLAEARAQLSTMATEELKATMAHAKAKSQVAGLLSGVAKAKQGGLVDASALFEAEALLPVVAAEELDAAAKRAKVRGELDILSLAVGKAEREELVAAPALSEAKALMPAVATEELRVAMKSAKQLRALQPAIAKSREGKLVDASVVAEAMALVPAVASEELHAAMQQARWHIQSNAHRSTTAASFTESKLRSVITAAENGEGGLTGLTHLRRNVFNVPTYTFRATILFGAKAADTGVADNSGCILSRLRPSLRFPRPFSLKVKRLIWDYAGVRHGPVWDRIDAAHSVLTASIGEANRLPATMATEELSRAIKRARDTDRPRALRTAIAAAEKEQLADASVIEEARALLPVAESALIVELKKLQEVDKEDDPGLYMHKQGDLSWGMRAILIDWLVEVVRVKGMNPNIIYMCVNLIDRYLAANQVLRGRLQLVGITALYVTCKEDYKTETISADTCAYLTAGAYTKEEVLEMEEKVRKINTTKGACFIYAWIILPEENCIPFSNPPSANVLLFRLSGV